MFDLLSEYLDFKCPKCNDIEVLHKKFLQYSSHVVFSRCICKTIYVINYQYNSIEFKCLDRYNYNSMKKGYNYKSFFKWSRSHVKW